MTATEVPADAVPAVLARRRKEIGELDYKRELIRLKQHGYTQRQISQFLGIAQPTVLSALRTAEKVSMPLDGYSGATPYEICQRYAGGLIDRPQLVDELTRFPYVKGGETDGFDSLIVDPPGTWSEVEDAARRGLIDDDVYEEVFNRRYGIAAQAAEQPEVAAVEAAAQPIRSARTSSKDLKRQAARAIAKAIGGGQVTEKNGRFVIRNKAGLEVVIDKRGKSKAAKALSAGRIHRGNRVPVGRSAVRAGALSRERHGD